LERLFYPPSLDSNVLATSFRAGNGELGLLPQDVTSFLGACRQDGLVVLGWELWIVDFQIGSPGPVPAPGSWAGLIPWKGPYGAAVVGGQVCEVPGEDWEACVERSSEETLAQIGRFSLSDVDDDYVSHVRYSFTLKSRDSQQAPEPDKPRLPR
jgi:hypothetical protein